MQIPGWLRSPPATLALEGRDGILGESWGLVERHCFNKKGGRVIEGTSTQASKGTKTRVHTYALHVLLYTHTHAHTYNAPTHAKTIPVTHTQYGGQGTINNSLTIPPHFPSCLRWRHPWLQGGCSSLHVQGSRTQPHLLRALKQRQEKLRGGRRQKWKRHCGHLERKKQEQRLTEKQKLRLGSLLPKPRVHLLFSDLSSEW